MMSVQKNEERLSWTRIGTPQGTFTVMAANDGVYWLGTPRGTIDDGLAWIKRWLRPTEVVEDGACAALQLAVTELQRYFAGTLTSFSCPLQLRGTPFQLRVWQELLSIPYGETRSYGEIASSIGAPNASRAVGAANGANPISVIVPCHRVIGGSGHLTGYGGGLVTKSWLLALEGYRGRKVVQEKVLSS